VLKTFLFAAQALGILALLLFRGGSAIGETCPQCQQKVQTDWATCVKQLPKKIKPAVRGKPTDTEKQAIAERATRSRACSTGAHSGFDNCRITARCP
jgi:hypothetical protein